MQDWMRKHRRLIMFFILVFIGIPFVFMFGMPMGSPNRQGPEDSIVATVGGVPITESEFRRQLDAAIGARRGQEEEPPTYRDLDKDGTVQRVIENLVDSALIKLQEQQRGFVVDESLLSSQMQQWEMFQDEEGNFNRAAWNEWVASVTTWDEIYADVGESLARQMYLNTVMAPGNRVTASKINEELKGSHTKLRVKFAKIEPPLDPSEEELKAHYDANPEAYRLPEQVRAEFMTISLAPPMPEIAKELVERARQGEDFVELAKAHSSLSVPEGGEMGWRAEEEFMAPHLKPLFDLNPGEISDPVVGPTGYFIYKNEEERINEETDVREVFGRQIVLNVQLDATERTAREAKADEIAARLQGGEEPQSVAESEGLEIKQTNFFDRTSEEIDAVDYSDLYQFRSQVVEQKDTPWKPIKARNSIILAHVVETRQGDVPPFEEVQEDAREKVIAEKKKTEEYKARLAEYSEKLKSDLTALEDIKTVFPELDVEIQETEEAFTPKDSLFQYQLYVQASEIHKALTDAEPGDIAGPLSGFFGEAWFFELVERIEPTEEVLADLEGEREEIENRLKQTRKYELLADYTKDLRERMLASVTYQQNTAVLDRILGRDIPEETDMSGEGESSDDIPGEGESTSPDAESDAAQEGTEPDDTEEGGDMNATDADVSAVDDGQAETDVPAQETPAP